MQRLRHATSFARWVLVWFALSLGVAVASPLVQPPAFEQVCTGGTMKLVPKSGEFESKPAGGHAPDCPLCASPAAPPPVPRAGLPAPQPLAHAVRSIPAARIAARTAAPLPARGPPASSLPV
jgi:hypothetical protein